MLAEGLPDRLFCGELLAETEGDGEGEGEGEGEAGRDGEGVRGLGLGLGRREGLLPDGLCETAGLLEAEGVVEEDQLGGQAPADHEVPLDCFGLPFLIDSFSRPERCWRLISQKFKQQQLFAGGHSLKCDLVYALHWDSQSRPPSYFFSYILFCFFGISFYDTNI